MRSIRISSVTHCASGMADGSGTLGLQMMSAAGTPTFQLVRENGAPLDLLKVDGMRGNFMQQPEGFTGLFAAGDSFFAYHWDSEGRNGATTLLRGAAAFRAVPGGGVVVAGYFAAPGGTPRNRIWMLESNDVRVRWERDLDLRGAIVGVGADRQGRSVVLAVAAPGVIDSQWFDRDGLTSDTISPALEDVQAGASTWFETAPLLDGTLAVRRIDEFPDGSGGTYRTARWVRLLNVDAVAPPPAWLAARPNTNVAIIDSLPGYAVLPMGAPNAALGQQVELLDAGGNSCGSFDTALAGQGRTEDVAMGADGTLIQLLPPTAADPASCTYRWWPQALR